MITSLSPYTVSKHETVSVSNFRYPWERTFEMTFDVKVAVTDSGTKGDVNDDGRIILNDYLMSKRIEAGTKTADIDMLARADINGDGKINKADYDQIKKHILGD